MIFSCVHKTVRAVALGIFILFSWVSFSHGETNFIWDLKGTGLDKGHAYAILQNKETGKQQWVGVGEKIDEARVVRIERGGVALFDLNNRRIDLTLAGLESDSIPPLVSSPADKVETGKDLNAFLSDEFGRLIDSPVRMTENDRKKLVEELKQALNAGKLTPDSTTLVIGGGEEWVTGAKTSTAIQSIGLQKEDRILLLNGISPDSDPKKWENIFDVIKKARLVIVAYLHGNELGSKVFEVR
jgi:hypothetical protein